MCPEENTEELIEAMARAGAGIIGNYSHCAFITPGFWNWLSEEGSNPTIGKVGKMSREPENKIEMVCPEESLKKVLKAIKNTHPYENPPVDIVKLEMLGNTVVGEF